MTVNPNPRTWRCGLFIIDLESVKCVSRSAVPETYYNIYFHDADAPLKLGLDDENAKSLVDAFEVYRSER